METREMMNYTLDDAERELRERYALTASENIVPELAEEKEKSHEAQPATTPPESHEAKPATSHSDDRPACITKDN